MKNLLSKFKTFNNNHRKLVPFIIYFEILVIVFASIFKGIRRHFVVALAALLLILGIFAAVKLIPGKSGTSGADKEPEVVETVSVASASEASSETDEAGDVVSAGATLASGDTVSLSEIADTSAAEVTDKTDVNETAEKANIQDKSSQEGKTSSKDSSSKNGEKKDSETKEIVDTIIIGEDVGQNISQEAFDKFVQRYTDTVGWLYFEDERLSYPIMRSSDNDKYSVDDYAGNESETGAIFLDFRCDPEFTDSNSIIYGHNMRNRTMFGALRIYKEDLSFLDQHKYFQIRTSSGISRYMIFAFMDVPKDSYIYDVYGKNPSNMREYLDTIEYKTYIDTGIEPTVDDQIVMLSTCTKSDDLYFVMFAVKVDE
ncbi:class B sortase [Butyrivibrio sp. XBB1001]|uniref:class B sortase n=1 Tax=Butyrivibrio sp. XBB1001 TaxID=1280682 RepID=UPI000424B9DC|nr:class B sortase [Butyrivibrio sp. XBB1001]